MIGYKAFNNDLTCKGMQYEIGKEYKMDEEPIPCERGYHFCKAIADCYVYYDMSDSTRICKVEAIGDIETDDNIKYCTNHIRILEEVTEEHIRKANVTSNSSGFCNSGYKNSGNRNSGDSNSGSNNSGSKNSGNWNSGNWNSGVSNSGNNNSGNNNSGDSNSGDSNSGNWNSGSSNSGDWNSGNYNSGVFNTDIYPTIKMFDKTSSWTMDVWLTSIARGILKKCPRSCSMWVSGNDMTEEEKNKHPEYKTIGGYIKTYIATMDEKQKWWEGLSENDKEVIKALPNFDADKFCECVGIEHI